MRGCECCVFVGAGGGVATYSGVGTADGRGDRVLVAPPYKVKGEIDGVVEGVFRVTAVE